jgi:small subunit ribosomal protein S2
VVVIDPRREKIAVLEARKLGIPVIALIDTDSDPSLINIAIPGNDDALRSVQLVLRTLMDSVMEGKELAKGEVTPIPGGEVVAVEGAPAAASPEEQPPAEGASADVGGPDAASPPTDAAGTEEKPPETSSGESPA